ncbi:MAG: hypothetical protein ACO34E_12510, partial [Limisphaerales bacterium]
DYVDYRIPKGNACAGALSPVIVSGLSPGLLPRTLNTHADSYEKNQQGWFVGCCRQVFTVVESGL